MTENEILITIGIIIVFWIATGSGSTAAPKSTAKPGERMIDDAELIKALMQQRQQATNPKTPEPTREDLLLKLLAERRGQDGHR